MADQPAAYHRSLPLTLEQIQGLCSERVYHQARAYVDSSHTITDRMRVQSRLTAKFHGTRGIYSTSLDLTTGELFLVCFIIIAVVSWSWWPRLGEMVAGLFAGPDDDRPDHQGPTNHRADE